MNARANLSHAVRRRVRSVTSWLIGEREARMFDPFVRRGGGLLVLAALSAFAGWGFTKYPGGGDGSQYPAERCLRVVAVVRLATGRPELPGPFLLVQTAWTRDAAHAGSRSAAAECDASERTLPVPPIHNRVFRRSGAVFELTHSPALERVLDRLFELTPKPGRAPSTHAIAPNFREST